MARCKFSGIAGWIIVLVLVNMVSLVPARAHCEIPCGIYDDHARIQVLLEHADTVEKSARLIVELSGKSDPQSENQLVRWVVNKESHAQKIIDVITSYFLTQRVNPKQKDYIERLVRHHAVILAAVAVKQNVEPKYVAALIKSIKAIADYYPEHNHL